MGALFSRLCCVYYWVCGRGRGRPGRDAGRELPENDVERRPDDSKGKPAANGTKPKRRALLVGISYKHSPCNDSADKWGVLEGPFADVELFQGLLTNIYKYSPNDIIVLKDDPDLSDLSQPTRVNMIRELKQLVAGAAPGDMFTFLYSGHSHQQEALIDPNEEDHLDEVIITSDLKRIIDDELNHILVKNLPVGCSLVAIFDTCHSGTLLDLPHYYCNNLYVPWLSKGERRTRTYHNEIVRGNALNFVGFPMRRPTSFVSVMTSQWLNDAPSGSPLRIITEIDGIRSASQHKSSVEAERQEGHARLCSSPEPLLSPDRQVASPVGTCDGWCLYEPVSHPTVLSLSACEDLQRAWEGPRGSLTAVLCRFLEKYPHPSYRKLMTHINFQLYENCRALHEYTLAQKKKAAQGEGPGFDGELNNFQSPQLSSMSKLKMSGIFGL